MQNIKGERERARARVIHRLKWTIRGKDGQLNCFMAPGRTRETQVHIYARGKGAEDMEKVTTEIAIKLFVTISAISAFSSSEM